jgi:hypothetical protein
MNRNEKWMIPQATHLTEIQLNETFVEVKSATNDIAFGTLHNVVLNIDDQLLCYGVQIEVDTCMMNCDDRLRRFSKTLTT